MIKLSIMATAINNICPICADTFTLVARKQLKCPYCQNYICSKCVEKYLLSTIEDPHCPHCRKAWNRNIINNFCTPTFLNQTYFKYRQDILLGRERSYLPGLQQVAELEIQAREMSKEVSAINTKIVEYQQNYYKQISIFNTQSATLLRKIYRLRRDGRVVTQLPETGVLATDETEAVEKKKFIRRCTVNGCTGFVSSVWKCGICSNWICPDCYESKGQNKDVPHTCQPDILETANLIRKDTKPCPACGELIMKVDGCDQMWCITCHTPFSWRNGTIITEHIVHNPHYFEWLQRSGGVVPRNPHDIPCGGLISAFNLRDILQKVSKNESDQVYIIYRVCAHILDVERHRFEVHMQRAETRELGVKYLLKDIDEDSWKKTLAKREKDRQKSAEIREILDAFVGATITLFQRFETRPDDIKLNRDDVLLLISQFMPEIEELRVFTMEALLNISRSYNCSIPYITNGWDIIHGKHTYVTTKNKKKSTEE